MNDDFFVGLVIGVALIGALFLTYNIGADNAKRDVAAQCNKHGSIHLEMMSGEYFIYCARERQGE